MDTDSELVQKYRTMLKRIAWRIQYQARTRNKREVLISDNEPIYMSTNSKPEDVSNLFVDELLALIPSEKGRYIVKKTVLDGFTEAEVAQELQISQQAVSKWKRKSLASISQKMTISRPS